MEVNRFHSSTRDLYPEIEAMGLDIISQNVQWTVILSKVTFHTYGFKSLIMRCLLARVETLLAFGRRLLVSLGHPSFQVGPRGY